MATREPEDPRSTSQARIRKELKTAWSEIQRLADEVRLQVHLGGMDAKDRWKALEPRIRDFERKTAQATDDAGKGLEEIAKALAVDLEILRDRVGASGAIDALMHGPAIVCRSTDSLSQAAGLMWDHDIGIVLVIGDDGRLAGVITDRDIAMATYTKGRAPADIQVADCMATELCTCRSSDSIEVAESLMAANRIHRLPVVDELGRPLGLLSMNDLVRDAQRTKREDRQRGVVQTLAAIGAPRLRASGATSASADREAMA